MRSLNHPMYMNLASEGVKLNNDGRFVEAKTLVRQALNVALTAYGDDHEDSRELRNLSGLISTNLHDFRAALVQYDALLRSLERTLSEKDIELMIEITRNNRQRCIDALSGEEGMSIAEIILRSHFPHREAYGQFVTYRDVHSSIGERLDPDGSCVIAMHSVADSLRPRFVEHMPNGVNFNDEPLNWILKTVWEDEAGDMRTELIYDDGSTRVETVPVKDPRSA